MNNTTEVFVLVRGEVIDSQICLSVGEAERYKAAVRQWGRENGVAVSVMTRVTAAQSDDSHWLLRAS